MSNSPDFPGLTPTPLPASGWLCGRQLGGPSEGDTGGPGPTVGAETGPQAPGGGAGGQSRFLLCSTSSLFGRSTAQVAKEQQPAPSSDVVGIRGARVFVVVLDTRMA